MSDSPRVLISACLLGHPVRYDGQSKPIARTLRDRLQEIAHVIPVCPEGLGGLATPRDPAEIVGGTAEDVLLGHARVITDRGADVTQAFIDGAQRTLEIAQRHDATVAILKQSSPSCGSAHIYDGHFRGKKIEGAGLTTALLTQHGIKVFDEHRWDELLVWLRPQ